MTLSPRGSEGLQTCARIKMMTLPLSRDVFVASTSMMLEPTAESHGYSTPFNLWVVCRFLGGKGISDYY
jgi:hypothetical protein